MTTDWNLLEKPHATGTYVPRGIALVRGEGARVFDQEGHAFIDCVGGHGSTNLGHAHPALQAAVSEQASRLITCPGSFGNDQRTLALQALARATKMSRSFLCNSGTEAIEGALKAARVLTGRSRIVAFKRGFHGRSMGALSATWNPKYRKPFQPLIPDFTHGTFNDVAGIESLITEETAGVLVEVIQGEGGVHPASLEFLSALRKRCRSTGALLIFDEVQSGFGRTGAWFAFNHYQAQDPEIAPDILALAKGIAGGVPMGAFALDDSLSSLPVGSHGSTFGGNPLACAACVATLETLEAGLIERASSLGHWAFAELRRGLGSHSNVREVRGRGLMIGIESKHKVAPWLHALKERGILAMNAGTNVLRLLPPLVITEEELKQVVNAVIETVPEAAISASS